VTSPRRTPAPAAAREERPAVRPRVTGRMAVLVLVLAVLALSYTSSLRAYLEQRDQIAAAKAEIAERQQAITDLQREKERWGDPAYVEQQARERLGYVMPGEKAYIALDENGERLRPEAELADPDDVGDQTPTAWWEDVWESVELAGDPPETKRPATEIDGSEESTDQ